MKKHLFGFTEEQIHALWKSAEHWLVDNINARNSKDAKIGAPSCPCCQRWYEVDVLSPCHGCPIMQYSGHPYYENTPYDFVPETFPFFFGDENEMTLDEFKELAIAEYRFLVSLALGDEPE